MFIRTKAINKLLTLTKRKRIVQGGTWAGKTFGIVGCIIDYATKHPNQTGTIVAETIPAIKGGALKDFKHIMQITGRWFEDRFNATDLHYTFANGFKLEFKSFDSVGKAQAAGKRDLLFINEGPYINYQIADALIMRTTERIWVDFNPTQEFWAHTELLSNNDAEFLLLKAEDNQGLPDTIKNELNIKLAKAEQEKDQGLPITSYWQNWKRVYFDGEIGSLQGVVFNNWQQIDTIPDHAEFLCYALDWGYTNDPTAVVAVYKSGNKLYVDQILYEPGLTNSMIIDKLRPVIKRHKTIIADSAEPKSITDLQNGGFNVEGARKGPDSIMNSIDILQGMEIFVTTRSVEVIKEFRSYRWRVDKSGKSINEPVDANNHAIDAIRYAALNRIGSQDEIILG